ncbi:SRPBCC family protein [Micromonospora mirobrigensis]|uniref:Polyketide cyclase / dehydrase and lipid transport n=1 Tax=Micromonospora mirobrigensis TaxID=262898 RepID=A0A1C5A108_9ACTN|nr:SRPBCC family protein [Micromonospora mirobrigensis]SCF38942.1 Polyketide cyclase / dehydrase and lipid transport [Micromonospora mirobrigensis]
MRFEATSEVAATRERIWAVTVDVERWAEWTPSVTRARRLDAGPFTVGSAARIEQPRLRPAVWRVTELVEPHFFRWVSRSPGVRTLAEHRLEPLPDGRVRVVLSAEMSGPLAGLAGRLGGGLFQRYLRLEADGLKRRCEQG